MENIIVDISIVLKLVFQRFLPRVIRTSSSIIILFFPSSNQQRSFLRVYIYIYICVAQRRIASSEAIIRQGESPLHRRAHSNGRRPRFYAVVKAQ